MSEIKLLDRYLPTLPPRSTSFEMRNWLNQEFELVAISENEGLQAIDEIQAAARMFLAGDADDFNLDTIDSQLVNFTAGGALGIVPVDPDLVAGLITIPVDGIYTMSAYVYGLQGSPTQNQTIRLLGDVDGVRNIIATIDVSTPITVDRTLLASISRFLPAGAVASLYMNATADMGLFEIQTVSFEISNVTPLDQPAAFSNLGLDW